MSYYVLPGMPITDMTCDGVTACPNTVHCWIREKADDGMVVRDFPVCYPHLKEYLGARPFVAKQGTQEARERGEYEVEDPKANAAAPTFTLDEVDCNKCGKTHRNVLFTKVEQPYLVRSANGVMATITHHARCFETDGVIVFGVPPRNRDF